MMNLTFWSGLVQNENNHKQELIAAYNRMARERDKIAKDEWKVNERDRFVQLLKEHGTQKLLEIGAGTGQDGLFYQQQGFDVTCVDMSSEMVVCCREKGLAAYEMDFAELAFPEASFDAVWALNCLLHVPKKELDHVLAGIRRVLRPGGLFFMGVYGRENSEGVWEHDDYVPKRFFSFFDEETLRARLSRFFEVVTFSTIPHSAHMDFQSITMIRPNA